MIKNSKKIPAFSLIETLVALAVTAIVVSLAYMLLLLITKNVTSITDNYFDSNSKDLAAQQMMVDFNRCNYADYNIKENSIALSSPLEEHSYFFEDQFLIRDTDTLLSTIDQKQLFFLGKEVKSGAIDAIKIYLKPKDRNAFIFISKQTDAQTRMTQNGN